MTTATYATERARATAAPTLPVLRFDPSKEGAERWLGPLEAAIMEVVWSAGRPVTVKAVWRLLKLDYHPKIAYTTAMTTMTRLAEKRLLERTRKGMAYVYTAVETREQFEARQRAAILASLEDE